MLAIMDHSQMRDGYHEDEFNNTGWAMPPHGYHSPNLVSPAHEYGSFNFNQGQMPMANVYAGQMQHPSPQAQFPPTWPSMLTNPPHSAPAPMSAQHHMAQMSYAPPQPLPPLITNPIPPPAQPQSTSRRTLTDNDRRRMCQYHEENPTVKQTEIGAMFGVERSTVSKVLRNKEKYLAQEDGSKSPIRRAKGKFPDIERALTNWAMKHQQKGMQLTDQAIKDKARFFAASVGNPEASAKVNSTSWLEKFKQKNQIGSGKGKKAATSSKSDLLDSPTTSGVSPVSPSALDPSPLTRSPEDRKRDLRTDSPTIQGGRLVHSKSTASLASAYSESASSFTSVPPPLPAIYEQHMATMSEAMQQHQQQQSRMLPPNTSEGMRPKSLNFPMTGVDSIQTDVENNYTDGHIEDIMAHSALETPQDEYPGRSLSVTSLSSVDLPHLQHSHSASMLGTPGLEQSPSVMMPMANSLHPGSGASSNVTSPIGLPTLDDGKRGLEMAMNFLGTLPSGVVDPQEYMLLGKLMEKLKGLGSPSGEMPGGMHSINVKKEMDRKRSVHSL